MHPTVLQNPARFDEFARAALKKSIREICVTDHMPLSISSARDRIPHGEVKSYCRRVREIAKSYEGILTVKLGIEIDYHKSAINEIETVLSAGEFDYILASSHMHVFTRDFTKYTFNDFAKMALENSIESVEYGHFSAVSHVDMYRWAFGNHHRFPLIKEEYDPMMHKVLFSELLDKMANRGVCLEINPHYAEAKGDISYTYPEAPVLEMALAHNLKFSYGSDAHEPKSVGTLLDELEAHPIYAVALRKWENE